MFADADAMMAKGNFDDAAKQFEAVDREHPYSPEARKSIVMAAYAYYRAGKSPEAIASAERYLNRLNEALMMELQLDGRVYPSNAVIDGRFALRACIVNYRTEVEHIDALVAQTVEKGRSLHTQLSS